MMGLLVGGDWNMFYDFPETVGKFVVPNCYSAHHFSGRAKNHQPDICIYIYPIIVPLNHIKPPWKIPPSIIPLKIPMIGIPSEIILLNFYNGLGWIMVDLLMLPRFFRDVFMDVLGLKPGGKFAVYRYVVFSYLHSGYLT